MSSKKDKISDIFKLINLSEIFIFIDKYNEFKLKNVYIDEIELK
jgi:hypothetical protein